MPRALRATSDAGEARYSDVLMVSTIGRIFAAKRSASVGLNLAAKRGGVSGVAGIAQTRALRLPLGKRGPRALGDQPTLLLGERGVEVQHEGIGIGARARRR